MLATAARSPPPLILAMPDARPDGAAARLAGALAGSLAVHALVLAALALALGAGAGGSGGPFDTLPLRATLAGAPAPPSAPASVVTAPTPLAPPPPVRPAAPRPLPVPVPFRPVPAVPEPYEGHVAVLPDDGAAVDPSIEAAIAVAYAGATRAAIEFDEPPRATYPVAARRERRQVLLRVPAVVRDDGAMEVAQGTFDDPVFGAAVREALANARVRDPPPEGAPRAWTVLTFLFEFYGSGESQRSVHESPR
ncbi:MAG: hypothetical protein BroJett026_09010 [Betaproteobacteria bacterium]|nr:MAG: hypothetical protein BroJett026_09010 [Betaproteobacteria bacterium]